MSAGPGARQAGPPPSDTVGLSIPPRRLVDRWLLPPLLLVAAFVAIMAWVGSQRVVGDYPSETDLYHYYAPDADRLRAGRAPENPFQGPGYPLLLVLVSPWSGGDHFTGGKWLALAAAATTGLAAAAVFRQLLGARTVVLGLLFVLTNFDFARYSVHASTDMVFLALAVLTIAVLIIEGPRPWVRAVIGGALTGLAWLVRYNGVFLVPTGLLALAAGERNRGRPSRWLRLAAIFLAAALATAAPWMIVNHRRHGSPVYSASYLNIAAMAYGFPPDQDGTRPLSAEFHSLGEVVRYDPLQLLTAYLRNLAVTVRKTLGSPLTALGILAVAGAAGVLRGGWRAPAAVLPVSAAALILLMALTHWESRYFLYVGVCYAGLAALAIVDGAEWVRRRRAAPALGRLVAVTLALCVLVPALGRTHLRVSEVLNRQPTELLSAAAWLRASTPRARVLARKPHLAYLAGAEWVFLPPVASPEALATVVCQEGVTHVVWDEPTRTRRPSLAGLASSAPGLPWLALAYSSAAGELLVYEVRLDAVCPGHAAEPRRGQNSGVAARSAESRSGPG